ncbi:MAG: hypothetical protein DELT_01033 [Desulfovibrio sp.]
MPDLFLSHNISWLLVLAGAVAGYFAGRLAWCAAKYPAVFWERRAAGFMWKEASPVTRAAETEAVSDTGSAKSVGQTPAVLFGCACAVASALLLSLPLPAWRGVLLLPLGWALLAVSVIDIRHRLLPDLFTLPLLAVGLACNVFGVFAPPLEAFFGGLGGYFFLFAVNRILYACTGREGFGGGDCKLLAALGAWGGWRILPATLLLASLGAVAVWCLMRIGAKNMKREEREIPFGPYLAAAGWGLLLKSCFA